MNKDESALVGQFAGVLVSIVVGVAVQNDFAAQCTNGVGLDSGCRHRHHDEGADMVPFRSQRDALCVVAGRAADDAARQFLGAERGDLVISAAQFEREYRLQILAFHQHRLFRDAWTD